MGVLKGHHRLPLDGGGGLRQVLLGCYFRGLIGLDRDKDSQREAKSPLSVQEGGKEESPLHSRRSAIPPNTIPPSAPIDNP